MSDDYKDGVRDGEIKALKEIIHGHHQRISSLESSIKLMERVLYGMMGALVLINLFLPELKEMIT